MIFCSLSLAIDCFLNLLGFPVMSLSFVRASNNGGRLKKLQIPKQVQPLSMITLVELINFPLHLLLTVLGIQTLSSFLDRPVRTGGSLK